MLENEVPEMTQEEIDIRNELTQELFSQDYSPEITAEKTVVGEDEDLLVDEDDDTQQGVKDDPWEGVNPKVREAIESLQSNFSGISRFEERLKQAENRVGGIDNRLRDLKAAFPAKTQPTKETVEAALSSSKGWKTFQEDFPYHADAFKDMLMTTSTSGAGTGLSIDAIEKVREEMNTDFNERLNKQQIGFELKLLRMKYKNHRDLIAEPEFTPWLEKQPPATQALYGSWDAMDGIELLDAYTAHKSKKKELPDTINERRNRLKTAAESRRTSTATKMKSEADMTEAEYRDHVSKQIWGK